MSDLRILPCAGGALLTLLLAPLGPTSEWPRLCEAWLRFNGWLPACSDR